MQARENGHSTGFSLDLKRSQICANGLRFVQTVSESPNGLKKKTVRHHTASSLGLRFETEKAILSLGLRFETACRGGVQTWESPEKRDFGSTPLPLSPRDEKHASEGEWS
jgi:hypothetical protein